MRGELEQIVSGELGPVILRVVESISKGGRMWFTQNGKLLEKELSGVRGRLLPLLGLKDSVDVETNFGARPFAYGPENVTAHDVSATGEVNTV